MENDLSSSLGDPERYCPRSKIDTPGPKMSFWYYAGMPLTPEDWADADSAGMRFKAGCGGQCPNCAIGVTAKQACCLAPLLDAVSIACMMGPMGYIYKIIHQR